MKKKDCEKRVAKTRKKRRTVVKKYRFFVVLATFLLLCALFLIMLLIIQSRGMSKEYEDMDVRIETVQGERGRIFDRNGVLLVGNSTRYDLVFEYGSMAYTPKEVNEALLACIDTLNSSSMSSKRSADYFPLTGVYPNMVFKSDAKDLSSDIGYYFNRFLIKNKLDANITADELVRYFVKRYKLWEDLYTPSQISELIRLRYDMLRVDFGAYQSYTIAGSFDSTIPEEMAFIVSIKEKGIEGATMLRCQDRVCYFENYATHILGKVGRITAENVDKYEGYPPDAYVGISGCEYAFEEYLRGSTGKRVSKYNDNGDLVEQYYDPAPVAGKDIYLTIDIKLQIAAEDALEAEVERLKNSNAGAATAIDPQSGETLVIASYPKYDVSQFNRALQGTYAPGSTFKIGSALSALEQGNISESTTYTCNHVYPYLGGPTCLGNHGEINVSEAIRVSCNIFFYYVGHKFGVDSITSYTKRLGLGQSTGIELGEAEGIVATHQYAVDNSKSWSEFDDATGAIGQSYHAYTPLQLSVYMSSIVNHGTRYRAHLLKCVKTRGGEIVFTQSAKVQERVDFSDHTYNTLISAMGEVVSTSPNLTSYFSSSGVKAGGKTGTAETGRYDNALFSGFAPFDEPKIVASCVIEAGEAGNNAAKIVASIFSAYFSPDS